MAFTWIPFYKEFAQKLLKFRNNRQPLIDWIYSNIKSEYIKHLKDAPNGRHVADIDPFTVFAIFNRGISHDKRVKICLTFKNYLNISAPVPKDFDGIPVMNTMRSNFMAFADKRRDGDIERFWNVFEAAVTDRDIQKEYDALSNQYLIRFNLTMGLFWIKPDKYLPLDGNSRDLLATFGIKIDDKKYLLYADYVKVMKQLDEKMKTEDLGYSDYAGFSHAAYLAKAEVRNSIKEKKNNDISYWIYSPGENASKWNTCKTKDIMCIEWDELGDLKNYSSREEMRVAIKKYYQKNGSVKNDSLAVWQFRENIKSGDIVFAKKGRDKIIGRGIVQSDYIFDDNLSDFKHTRKVKWTDIGEWQTNDMHAMKTLTDITRYAEYVKKLNQLIEGTSKETTEPIKESYDISKFLDEVFINYDDYRSLSSLLLRKKNLILQGAPGVGKTFAARRLAYAIMGEKDDSKIMQIQFHQNYSYEDFFMGYKPNENGGFELKNGIFYRFCKRAATDKEHKYFFIIDEINRGNLSKIFGELLMLIENDYRDTPIQLSYKDELFSVPDNLYIIGMMNTADRSLAIIDYALRRRFSFFDIKPGFESNGFQKYTKELMDTHLDNLIKAIIELNKVIESDDSLGIGFCIGHSYLCNLENHYDLKNIVEYDIIPMLKEYWFDNDERFNQEAQKLRNALK